jgi:SAM-dependent methyltransferase
MTPVPDVRIIDQRLPEERDRPFLPGMGKVWLLPLYDIFTRLSGVRPLHERAVELAGVTPGQTVVDVGCGTGNLSFAVLAAEPGARVTGLDPDGDSLRRAARKARRRRVPLTLVQGYADRVPAEDAALDHVVSSLALHHVDDDGRVAFARDALRALRPGGKVTVVDFGGPAQGTEDAGHGAHDHGGHGGHGGHGHGPAHALRHLPHLLRSRAARSPAVARNLGDGIVALLVEAGFADAREVEHVEHRFGRITFVQGTRP